MRELWLALGLWLFFGLPAGDAPRERSKRSQPAQERAPATQPAEAPRPAGASQQAPAKSSDERPGDQEVVEPARDGKAAAGPVARSASQVHIGPAAPASINEPKLAAP
jgi:hypothetical protein